MDDQALQILKKYGYTPKAVSFGVSKPNQNVANRFAELDSLAQKKEVQTQKKTGVKVLEKVADFTGGKELSQGLGQAMALGKNSKAIEDTQNEQNQIVSSLIKRIKEKKALGQDTSKLEGALQDLGADMEKRGNNAEQILNPNQLTEKQIIGDALQVGTTILGAGALPGATKAVTGATTIGKGIVQGAKTGATTGAIFGGATGVSQGLQEDKSGKDILKQGLGGAVTGLIGGAVVGGLTGGITGGLKGRALRKEQKYLEAITPNTKDLTPTEYEDLLNRGKITAKTNSSPSQYILSEEEKNVASKYKNLFTNDPVKNTQNIIDEISKKDEEVGQFLRKNNGIFNTGELKNSVKNSMKDITDIMADDKKINKAKTALIDNFIKDLPKNDMESLWKGRKAFDSKIDSAFKGSPSLQKDIKIAFRNAIQDFISERTDDVTYKAYMKDMSQLFNLKDITNTKAVKEKGMNAIQAWIKRNPTKAKLIGWTAGTGVVGTVGASVLNN